MFVSLSTILKIAFYLFQNIELLIKEYEAFEPMKFLVIKLTKFLKANHRYVLKTSYKSKLSKNLLGFYQSSYKNKNGKNM